MLIEQSVKNLNYCVKFEFVSCSLDCVCHGFERCKNKGRWKILFIKISSVEENCSGIEHIFFKVSTY